MSGQGTGVPQDHKTEDSAGTLGSVKRANYCGACCDTVLKYSELWRRLRGCSSLVFMNNLREGDFYSNTHIRNLIPTKVAKFFLQDFQHKINQFVSNFTYFIYKT